MAALCEGEGYEVEQILQRCSTIYDDSGNDAHMFKSDMENIEKATGAEESIITTTFAEFKDKLMELADKAREEGADIVATIAAHGGPDGGVAFADGYKSQEEIEQLLDEAGVEVTINCPCYSQLGDEGSADEVYDGANIASTSSESEDEDLDQQIANMQMAQLMGMNPMGLGMPGLINPLMPRLIIGVGAPIG